MNLDYADGADVSRYQHPCNYPLGYQRGLRFVVIRATVGDYYTDATLRDSWNGYKEAGCLVSAYLVTAPRATDGGRVITADAHLDRFFNAVSGLKPDLPWVVDAELARGEEKKIITQLQKDVVIGLSNVQKRMPIIYTRSNWWDFYVYSDPLWSTCDLWPARYNSSLTGPWSDGYCKFRDWKTWKFWQYTSHADGKYFGFNSLDGDLDYFNGTDRALYEYAGLEPPLTLAEKVEILWREAELHGWNLKG